MKSQSIEQKVTAAVAPERRYGAPVEWQFGA
jgi:hypothetical protein